MIVFASYFLVILEIVRAVYVQKSSRPQIAICVGGQQGRWLPEFLFDLFVHENSEQDYYLFYNIQKNNGTKEALYSLGPSFHSSKMVDLDESATWAHLRSLQNNSKNARIVSVHYTTGKTYDYWSEVVNGDLDLFELNKVFNRTFFSQTSVNVMNMYQAHVKCAKQIYEWETVMSKEQKSSQYPWKFDFVISTREDVYFFKPLKMSSLLSRIRPSPLQPPLTAPGYCDLLTKDCLSWGGLNMRMFIMNREAGLWMLGGRFKFYAELHKKKWRIPNPERFELLQAAHNRLNICQLQVEDMPVTAARHTFNGEFCLYKTELSRRCSPQSVNVQNLTRCENILESATIQDHHVNVNATQLASSAQN